jgi:hypothetical protein
MDMKTKHDANELKWEHFNAEKMSNYNTMVEIDDWIVGLGWKSYRISDLLRAQGVFEDVERYLSDHGNDEAVYLAELTQSALDGVITPKEFRARAFPLCRKILKQICLLDWRDAA